MNVHVNEDPPEQEFSDSLLQIENCAVTSINLNKYITIDIIGRIVQMQKQLIQSVFPNLTQHFGNHAWLYHIPILASRNEDAYIINKQLLRELPGNLQVYKSIDFIGIIDEAVTYTTEFLNTLDTPGIRSHILELKVGAPIMILRNLQPPSLFNGTLLTIKTLMPNIIESTIMDMLQVKMYLFLKS